jgi:rhomboid protease GluP
MSNDPRFPLPSPPGEGPPLDYAPPGFQLTPIGIFRRDLFAATPVVFVTHTIIAANVLVFLAMVVRSGGLLMPSGETMVRWGAGFGPLTTNGQPWRLFTEMFLHFGILHIAMNMYVLWQGGPLVERLFGNFAYFVIYIFSGLTGSFLSLYAHPMDLAAGASGAVFGVYGALLGFLMVQRGAVPAPILKSLFNNAIFFVVANFALGAMQQHIDMAAHGGGVIGGLLLGAFLSRRLARGANLLRTVIVAIVGIALFFYLVHHLTPIPLS